ncbi:hypothetical protein Patl1_03002 [Pistacia atlantica]|uniref:Uncharacterized protein n=1 Tax=Pistacia atlantica TaxID=434234 RepID=A0ACC1C9G5_9ROSI|nr:hypothetical protein Patl1_03002 [Pistacia atlantica]
MKTIVMASRSSKDHITINTESLASSFENMMADNLFMSPNCCIFRTPKILLRHNEKAYHPNAFSIGPFHHETEQLKPTEKIKLKYLQGILQRSLRPKERLRQLIEAIRVVQVEAREYYAGPVTLNVEEFVKIMVLDGCFIIELLRKDADEVAKDPDDPIFSMSCLQEFLNHDLILLENQIPWLVLDCLFNLSMPPGGGKSLIQLTLDFFSNIFSSSKPSITPDQFNDLKIMHILDLLRHSLLLPFRNDESDEKHLGWQPFPCATSLKDAGIKFKRVSSSSILDITFSNGVLEIPPLLLQETTESILRNLISFEQCYPNCPPRVTSYAKLMDYLIDTTKDMEILCENDIFDNWLNLEDATQFFNQLYTDAHVKKFYYHELCRQVNSYCKQFWPRWRFFYVHNYFGKPWAVTAQIVVAIFLVFAFLHTYYTIKNDD